MTPPENTPATLDALRNDFKRIRMFFLLSALFWGAIFLFAATGHSEGAADRPGSRIQRAAELNVIDPKYDIFGVSFVAFDTFAAVHLGFGPLPSGISLYTETDSQGGALNLRGKKTGMTFHTEKMAPVLMFKVTDAKGRLIVTQKKFLGR